MSDKLCFLHNSPRREWFRVASILSGLFLPRQEVPRPGDKVVSLKRGYSRPGEKAPGASVFSVVFSPRREIFCPGEEVFSPGRERVFSLRRKKTCSLDYFRLYCVWFSVCDYSILKLEEMVLQMDLCEII